MFETMNAKYIIILARPEQWVKNFFVALPLFFSGALLDLEEWSRTVIAFFAFSFMASAVYCLNDIRDIESDKAHPRKCVRPLASGKVSVQTAWLLMAVLIAASCATCFLPGSGQSLSVLGVVFFYLALNIAYCLRLKQYAIVDVFIVSFGFVLRVAAGGFACDIWLSPWIILLTYLIALFLAFAKRRDDVALRERTGLITRKNTVRYNLDFLNLTLGIIGAVSIVCYILYTVSPDVEARMGSRYVYTTSIFVLAGILRYLQVSIVDTKSGSPTKILLHDRFIQTCIALWLLLFLIIIYL